MKRTEHWQKLKEQIPICDYAAFLGYTVIRCGRYYTLKEHESVRIDPVKNCFWRNSQIGDGQAIGKGGSIIDFVLEFTDLTLAETFKALENYLGTEPQFSTKTRYMNREKRQKEKGIQLPDRAGNMKRVFAYLVQTRKIDVSIVQEMVQKKQLYQDVKGNCVFVSYDENGRPDFACLRGTNTAHPFYGDVHGCDYTKGFYLDYGANRLYLTEAVIDTLSVMTLHLDDYKQWNHLAIAGGGKWEAVINHLNGIREVWVGTDNDETGRKAAEKIAELVQQKNPKVRVIFDFPEQKDWNDVLIKRSNL